MSIADPVTIKGKPLCLLDEEDTNTFKKSETNSSSTNNLNEQKKLVEKEKGKLQNFLRMTKCTTLTGNYTNNRKKISSPTLGRLGQIPEGKEERSSSKQKET